MLGVRSEFSQISLLVNGLGGGDKTGEYSQI